MRILLVNGYSVKNRGDFGIVLTTIEWLKTRFPDAELFIEKNYDDMIEYANYGVQLVHSVVPNNYKRNALVKYFLLMGRFISRPEAYDLVISVGGGYLYSSSKGPFGYGLMRVLMIIYLHSRVSKLVIYPQTAGPLRPVDSRVAAKLLAGINTFYARDRETFSWCIQNNLPVKLTNDTVFLKARKRIMHCKDKPATIGVTVVDHLFTGNGKELIAERKKYLKTLANFINTNFQICNLYLQVDYSAYNTDRFITEELMNMISRPVNLLNVSQLSVEEIIDLYRKNDLFVASRMHSAIFSLCSGTETIGIGYQPKTVGMFDLLGIPEYAVMIKDLEPEFLNSILAGNRGKKPKLKMTIWETL